MLAFPQMQPLDFIGPYDLFDTAGVESVVVAAQRDVAVDSRLQIEADVLFEDAPSADAVFVPGGWGVTACLADDRVLQFLQQCRVDWYTSVCTGSLLLAAAGLLRGYRATSHWRYVDLLELGGALPVRGERVVIDRNRMTGGGVTAGIDFGIRLLAQLCGEEQARLAQLALEYAPAPPYPGTPEEALPQTRSAYENRSRDSVQRRREEMTDAISRGGATA
jgi:cyclohexyl-isocyanide hydratase